ncbi:hypothetical protein TNCV_4202131 [Trichonephila clavipes]|nr:hypothetical protein TNCV_4202131 [Trichonephila clavipes]
MKFSEGCKGFEMCTNCSSKPASPAHIFECLGLTKQDLADDPSLVLGLSESVRCHGPGQALLTNEGVKMERGEEDQISSSITHKRNLLSLTSSNYNELNGQVTLLEWTKTPPLTVSLQCSTNWHSEKRQA